MFVECVAGDVCGIIRVTETGMSGPKVQLSLRFLLMGILYTIFCMGGIPISGLVSDHLILKLEIEPILN